MWNTYEGERTYDGVPSITRLERNAARTGGTATNGPTGAAGLSEAEGSTIIFTCDHSADPGNAVATTVYTCGDTGSFGKAEITSANCLESARVQFGPNVPDGVPTGND